MRSRRPLISVVLAAALLVGQWLSAAHEPDHALKPGAAHACSVCVYSHGAGAGALPSVVVLQRVGAHEAPEIADAGSTLAASLRNHPIRGPPALLA